MFEKMNYLSLAILIFTATVAVVWGLGCDVPVQHYKTMKCTPVGGEGTICPTRFECPSITHHDNSLCYYNGKTYNVNEQVPNELVSQFCSALCYCRGGSPFAQFRCTHIDCAEFSQRFDYENCIRQYQPDHCCSSGKVCGEDKQKLAKCTLKGETFLAGERMSPAKCVNCICHEGFSENNIGSDPHCYQSICGFELFYAKQVYTGGAPVYYEDRCCPWEWRMPKNTDQIAKRSTQSASSDPQLQCKYGKLTMNIGDTLVEDVTEDYTYRCSCLIPPLAQCVMTKNK